MNILVFSPYYPPHTGGLESHSEEFARALATQGVSLTIFAPLLPEGSPHDESPQPGVRIIRYPAFEIISNFPAPKFWQPVFWRQLSSLSAENFNFVISRTRFFLSSLLALAFARYRKLPLVHIEHGSDFVQLSSELKTFVAKIYDLIIGKLIFRSSTITISISEAVKRFVARFDDRPSPVIYRGINFAALDAVPSDEALRQEYAGKIILSTVARLYHWKGIAVSVEAIRQLPDDLRSKIIFLIVGDGEDFDRLQTLGAGLPIVMLGRRKNVDVIGILKSTDIYLHSSFPGGGLSTSLLEALACGTAVIATRNEGAEEVVEHDRNGILVEAPDSALFRTAIETLANDPTRRNRYGQSTKQSVRERFDWGKTAEQYLKILKDL